jgi:transposase InsO family protein
MSQPRQSTATDPRRRLRRNHYQEGPGFLFLATQNGRPEIHPGPRRGLDYVRARMRVVRMTVELGVEAAARLSGVPRRSVHRWLSLFEARGIAGLVNQSRRPARVRQSVPAWVDLVIVAIRLNTYWNSKRIAAEMDRRGIYRVSPDHIDRLFHNSGTRRGTVPSRPGPRYERSEPNQLWHIDIKGPFFINLGRREFIKTWILGLVDDHSRFVIGLRILTETGAVPVLRWLDDCFELCGQPLDLMSDNGQPFVTWVPGVLTRFGKRLKDLRIHHLRTQINSPWTNGKIEAFWDILQDEVLDRQLFGSLAEAELALERFATYYNYHRLSGVLGFLTPAERYDGTPFTDLGFANIPTLEHFESWLADIRRAA